MAKRKATVIRKTGETKVRVELVIEGKGKSQVKTGIGMLDHLVAQLAKHSLFDIKIQATGDIHVDQHHTLEDVAISLGKALSEALGTCLSIVRMGHAVVPMDDALALVAVDIGGRGYAVVEASFVEKNIGELSTDLVRHFLESFALEARLNLHARILSGVNDHHKIEALFKALGRALGYAVRIDERIPGEVPSTKGSIEGVE
ncbi:imidazoleglycerol-phosphate dehydratase HisB [Chloroflexota bacterium]